MSDFDKNKFLADNESMDVPPPMHSLEGFGGDPKGSLTAEDVLKMVGDYVRKHVLVDGQQPVRTNEGLEFISQSKISAQEAFAVLNPLPPPDVGQVMRQPDLLFESVEAPKPPEPSERFAEPLSVALGTPGQQEVPNINKLEVSVLNRNEEIKFDVFVTEPSGEKFQAQVDPFVPTLTADEVKVLETLRFTPDVVIPQPTLEKVVDYYVDLHKGESSTKAVDLSSEELLEVFSSWTAPADENRYNYQESKVIDLAFAMRRADNDHKGIGRLKLDAFVKLDDDQLGAADKSKYYEAITNDSHFAWKVSVVNDFRCSVAGDTVYTPNGNFVIEDTVLAVADNSEVYLTITRDSASRFVTNVSITTSAALPADDYFTQYIPLAFVDRTKNKPVFQKQLGEIRLHELMLVENGEFKLATFQMSARNTYDPPSS